MEQEEALPGLRITHYTNHDIRAIGINSLPVLDKNCLLVKTMTCTEAIIRLNGDCPTAGIMSVGVPALVQLRSQPPCPHCLTNAPLMPIMLGLSLPWDLQGPFKIIRNC